MDLNVKCKTIKSIEDSIEKKLLDDLGCGSDFLDTIIKAPFIKEIIYKLDFIKIKNFCSRKCTTKRMKRQVTDLEKIFAKYISEKGMLPKVHTQLLKLNNKKTTNQLKNGPKTLTVSSPKKIYGWQTNT